jgi:hypothetical protein
MRDTHKAKRKCHHSAEESKDPLQARWAQATTFIWQAEHTWGRHLETIQVAQGWEQHPENFQPELTILFEGLQVDNRDVTQVRCNHHLLSYMVGVADCRLLGLSLSANNIYPGFVMMLRFGLVLSHWKSSGTQTSPCPCWTNPGPRNVLCFLHILTLWGKCSYYPQITGEEAKQCQVRDHVASKGPSQDGDTDRERQTW